MQQQRNERSRVAAFTITETLVAMLISGILLLGVYEGIGTIRRFTDKAVPRMLDGSDVMGGVERFEALFARTDSVHKSGERYLLYGVGEPVAVLRADSLLIVEFAESRDTLFRNVRSVYDRSAARVDSLFVTLGLADRAVCLGFAPVVRDGSVMDHIREQETLIEKRYNLPALGER